MAVSIKKIEKWSEKNKIGKLLKAVSAKDSEIRLAAIKALGCSNDESAMHTLISLLKDPENAIRAGAAEALGNMGNGRSIEFVKQLYNNETNESVRETARIAIGKIRDDAGKTETMG